MKLRRPSLVLLPFFLVAASATSPAFADVLWTTNPDMPTVGISSYPIGPSAVTPSYDKEAADDFNVLGSVERVVVDGQDCSGCGAGQPVTGATVRFYAWTPSGPGALQAEHAFAADDPAFEWTTCCGPGFMQLTLPQPFQATGWHFVSVQVEFGGTGQWSFHRTNVGSPMGGPAYFRDAAAGGAWTAFHTTVGWPAVDASFRLEGVSGGTPQPDVLWIDTHTPTPSGRLEIRGDAFGSTQGASDGIRIAGLPAFVTTWSDSTIVAYVPEAVTPGEVSVELVVGGVVVDSQPLTIVPRAASGRVRWRFALDGDFMSHRPGLAPDGSVVASDSRGLLYKLGADGGLQWVVDALRGQQGNAAEGRVVVGDDGRAIVAVNPLGANVDLVAFEPDGSLAWVYTASALDVLAGPAVGPDGNVYVAFNLGALVSLTPDGSVRWTSAGDPAFFEEGALGVELVFGPSRPGGPVDRVFVAADQGFDGRVQAFRLTDGNHEWATPIGSVQDWIMQFQHQPAAGSGAVYVTEFTGLGGAGWGLQALDASDGSPLWRFDPGIASGASGPVVGGDGTIYFSWDVSRLTATAPNGTERWTHVDLDGIRTMPSAGPMDDVVLVGGGPFGQPGFVKAIDASNGSELWKVHLPAEDGDIVPDARALFTPDGATAYVATSTLADDPANPYCYLYAFDVADPASSTCTALPNSSGVPAHITWTGSTSVSANDFRLDVSGLPAGPQHTGIFIVSPDEAETPLGNGNLCLGTQTLGFIVRLPGFAASAAGTASLPLDLTATLPGYAATAGSTWSYQAWFRDFVGAGFNFSDAVRVTFQP